MDSFESLIKTIFESRGFWVQTSFKVNITKKEKREIGRSSSPRWEIDVVAYKGGTHELLAIECKSFLDSPGVKATSFAKAPSFKNDREQNKYKLFNEPILRKVVLNRLLAQLVENGSCAPETKVTLCLATGKIAKQSDRDELERTFTQNGWNLYTDEWIKKELIQLSEVGYENDIALVVAKILTRGGGE